MKELLITLLLVTTTLCNAGNCLVNGNKKIGDCDNVHVGPSQPLSIKTSGTFSGNFSRVTVWPTVEASISGNTGDILVKPKAVLFFSGNSGNVRVEGAAELTGNSGWVYVAKGGSVTIVGIINGVSGPGNITKIQGSIVAGVYTK